VPSLKLVTFDAAGTLIFPHPSVGEVYAEIAAEHGIQTQPDALEARFKAAFKRLSQTSRQELGALDDRAYWRLAVADTFGAQCPEEPAFSALFEDLWQAFATARRWRLDPYAHALFEELRALGLQLALVSNADARFHQVFTELGLKEAFDGFFLSGEVGAEKPEPPIFRVVEAAMGARGPEILHVGDSPRQDVQGARDAGWHALQIAQPQGLQPVLPEVRRLLDA